MLLPGTKKLPWGSITDYLLIGSIVLYLECYLTLLMSQVCPNEVVCYFAAWFCVLAIEFESKAGSLFLIIRNVSFLKKTRYLMPG